MPYHHETLPDVGVEQAHPGGELWRALWAHAAWQAVSASPAAARYEMVMVGTGTGLRHPGDRTRAVLVHPAAHERERGELALTVLGAGTHVLPRAGRSYIAYLNDVTDIVTTVADAYLSDGHASSSRPLNAHDDVPARR